ncbi:MAG: hypothetical protein IJ518_00130 [Clostridia bacterium]|nr:hypothetical protein [Clostridia bacterium]
MWIRCFFGALLVLVLAVCLAIFGNRFNRRWERVFDPLRTLLLGVILSAVILFIPLYTEEFNGSGCGPLETFLISVHNTIRLFVVDGDFDFVVKHLRFDENEWLYNAYSILFSLLFVLAPMLTAGFVLTFFKNFSAYLQYLRNLFADAYIFSELNEKSLALAESLHEHTKKKKKAPVEEAEAGDEKKSKKRMLVFTDVFDSGEERSYELLTKAKALGAVCFKRDITARFFRLHWKNSKLCFFTIGEDFTENTRQALTLFANYRNRKNAELFVSSTQIETELLLANACFGKKDDKNPPEMLVRRIHEVRSLVGRTLYQTGYQALFASAAEGEGGDKRITAVVVGMGSHGMEMTKALAWYGQMDGYSLEVHAFDRTAASERFSLACPELVGPFHYDPETTPGTEDAYNITVHDGLDVDSKAFFDAVMALPPATYVFVSLGNDELNIATAVQLREWYERAGHHPYIHAIVYNTDKKEALEGITNYKGQAYDIHFIGDMRTTYSEDTLLNNQLENKALARHKKWGEESEFWQYNYNYQSSIASAIHYEAKKACGIPGIEKASTDRTPEEREAIRRLEHRRWNAYMRSEGYCYGPQRNDLAKLHPCLVPFEALTPKQQALDDD